MKVYLSLALLPLAAVAIVVSVQEGEAQAGTTVSGDVARGRYITHDLAMCIQCHSPRDGAGNIIQGRIFRGAPFPVDSPYPDTRPFALQAPNIAGLTGYTDDEAFRLLTQGIAKRGLPPMAPMPPFRMNEEDARAVIAYLRSL